MPKISVILAVYNSENYLDTSLPSIINQSFKDIEIICIDDGSTDNTKNILDSYAKTDPRIIVINQENTKQGIARNNGLKYAAGEYIIFFDSDDEMMPDMLETLYNKAKETDADLVETNFISYYPDDNKKVCYKLPPDIKIPEGKVFNWKTDTKWIFQTELFPAWNKLVRRQLLLEHNIRFLEKLPCEDVNFTIQCRLYANKIVFINKPFIKYNYRINSSCRTISKSSFNIFKNLSSILQFLKDTGNENILRENFYQFCSESVTNNYYTTPDRLKKFYDKKCSRLLPVKFYKIYKNRVCGSTKFIQNIFSITNYLTPQKKYKYLNILGLHFLLYTK